MHAIEYNVSEFHWIDLKSWHIFQFNKKSLGSESLLIWASESFRFYVETEKMICVNNFHIFCRFHFVSIFRYSFTHVMCGTGNFYGVWERRYELNIDNNIIFVRSFHFSFGRKWMHRNNYRPLETFLIRVSESSINAEENKLINSCKGKKGMHFLLLYFDFAATL